MSSLSDSVDEKVVASPPPDEKNAGIPQPVADPLLLKTHSTTQARLKSAQSVQPALLTLSVLIAASIIGVSSQALYIFETTNVRADFLLPLWPDEFNLGPTVALIVCGVLVLLANLVSALSIRTRGFARGNTDNPLVLRISTAVGLIPAVVAVAIFYAAHASPTVDTLESWTCRWEKLAMSQAPYFGTLCRQSRAGIYLSVVLVPLQLIMMAVNVAIVYFRRQHSSIVEKMQAGTSTVEKVQVGKGVVYWPHPAKEEETKQ